MVRGLGTLKGWGLSELKELLLGLLEFGGGFEGGIGGDS